MEEDYPKTLAELDEKLATESACRDYLFKLRWPNGFVCPRCKGGAAWTTSRNLFVREMRIPSFLDRGYHLPGHPEAANAVVSGDLVGDGAKEWSQRLGAAADSGFTQLHDGLDVAPQVAAGDGATRARTAQRASRG